MNVSRSGNFMSALPTFRVMFGVLNPIDRSASGNAIDSIWNPPENRGPVAANVFGSRGVWQPTQLLTDRARYSPRSFVAAWDGAVGVGLIERRGFMLPMKLLTTFPISVHSLAGTAFRTAGCP